MENRNQVKIQLFKTQVIEIISDFTYCLLGRLNKFVFLRMERHMEITWIEGSEGKGGKLLGSSVGGK